MAKQAFYVKACWDDEAKVFYSESNIAGLVLEASTLEEFEKVMQELAPDMIMENHIQKEDLATRSIRDLIPSIFWQRPEENAICA